MRTGVINDAQRVSFTYTDTVVGLGHINAGATAQVAAIVITQAFDDPGATIGLGMTYAPDLFLDPVPGVVAMFGSNELIIVPTTGDIIITVSPGASTQGAGYAVMRFY